MDENDFTLSTRLVDTTPPATTRPGSEDCTSDTCGSTPGTVGVALC